MSVALPPTAPAPAQADFVLHGAPSAGVRQQLAAQDLQEGLSLWRLFLTLGWLDIRLRYRGSVLGPFWLTLSTGVMVAALGVLYSALFKMALPDYLPFLAVSLVAGLGSGLLNPPLSAAVADIVGAERRGGTVLAGFQMTSDVGAILGPLVAGAVAQGFGYGPAFGLTGLVAALALALWLRAPETLPAKGLEPGRPS